jgi:vacuolar-type H+-ATPase subunit E/Vma4
MMLKDQLMEDAEKEIKAIHRDAAKKIAGIIEASEKEADSIVEKGRLAADREFERRLSIVMSEAAADARKEESRAFESIMTKMKKKIIEALDERWRSGFAEIAVKTLAFAAKSMKADALDAEFPSSFKELFAEHETSIRNALADQSLNLAHVTFSSRGDGGVIVRSADGGRVATLTSAESVRRREDEIRLACAERFGYAGQD